MRLEFYSGFFRDVELLARKAGFVPRTIFRDTFLTAYVQLATGKWHDKQVSGVLQRTTRGIYDRNKPIGCGEIEILLA